MLVTLRDGPRERSFNFVPPPPQEWQKQNGEFLIGYATELSEPPFDKVFIKRVNAKPVAHDLLMKVVEREIPGTPKVFGYIKDGRRYVYFFENLPPIFKLLESQIKDSHIICSEVVKAVVSQAEHTFEKILRNGFIYTDFCAKNIMMDSGNKRVKFIDLDSSWTIAHLSKVDNVRPRGNEFKINYWGLWNEYVSWKSPDKVDAVPKTMVLSFVAVWSRAIMLANHATKPERQTARNLVKNPSLVHQRALWDALKNKNRHSFMEYFGLSDSNGGAVYSQWERMFDDLRSGGELPWGELASASEHLLDAIEKAQKPQVRPARPAFVSKPVSPKQAGLSQTPATPKVSLPYLGSTFVIPTPTSKVLPSAVAPVATATAPNTALPEPDKGEGQTNAFARGFVRGFKRFLKPPFPYRR